jgi:hypothetical protein
LIQQQYYIGLILAQNSQISRKGITESVTTKKNTLQQ